MTLKASHDVDEDDKKLESRDWIIFKKGNTGAGFAWWPRNWKRMAQVRPVAVKCFEWQPSLRI